MADYTTTFVFSSLRDLVPRRSCFSGSVPVTGTFFRSPVSKARGIATAKPRSTGALCTTVCSTAARRPRFQAWFSAVPRGVLTLKPAEVPIKRFSLPFSPPRARREIAGGRILIWSLRFATPKPPAFSGSNGYLRSDFACGWVWHIASHDVSDACVPRRATTVEISSLRDRAIAATSPEE